ncbi:MAG: transcriptional antiterminator, Rof [Thiobacillus sp.]
MSEKPYAPIPCVQHERLEFAALTGQWLEVKVDGVRQRLRPLDVYTREGAEWLHAETDGGGARTLRLDRLVLAEDA